MNESSHIPFATKQTVVEKRLFQHSVKGVQFGIMPGEALAQYAATTVNHGHLYDSSGQPVPLGTNDVRMGVNARGGLCGTCGEPHETCPGHFGVVTLELPVFHVGYFRHTQQVVQSVCKQCCRILLTGAAAVGWLKKVRAAKARRDPLLSKGMFKKIVEQCKKVRVCPHCGGFNGLVKKGVRGPLSLIHDIPTTGAAAISFSSGAAEHTKDAVAYNAELGQHLHKSVDDLNPLVVLQLLRGVPRMDAEILDVESPEKLIVTHVPVPPVCIRPSVKMSNGYNQEDDLTVEVRNLASLNGEIKKALESGDPLKHVIERWYNLQGHVAMIINSDVSSVAAAYPRDKSVRSICTRLKGKEGRFRGNLSGKRVNFTGRTVISPDPNVEVFEVVVPEFIARRLTFPEAVNDHNIAQLRERIIRGNHQHPGAAFIRFAHDGSYKYLSSVGVGLRKEWAAALRPGDVVERHLVDGDIVLFNRQPSLHKMSIMAHRAKVMPSRTLRFNECVCAPYNADFDGDEMNLHLPQTLEAKAEAFELMGVQMNLITPKSGEPLIAATQDFLTASFLLTQRDTFLTRDQMCQAVTHCTRGMEVIDLPAPAILKPVELWTGKQVFSALLRPNRHCRVLVNLEMKEKNFAGSARGEDAFCEMDGFVLFRNSELLCGNLGKKVLGGSKPGLFFVIIRDASPAAAALAMGRVARLAARWLTNRGMTIGIDDVTPSAEIAEFKRNVTQVKYALVREKIDLFAQGKLAPKPGCTAEQTLEAIINGELGSIRNIVGDRCEAFLPRMNKPRLMAICGSKGSAINLSQMMLVLGQQNVNGQRIQDGFVQRTLPHFAKGSKEPVARGFVESSFCSGLQPWEFFFHTMGGREGLVDTAVKTAETGYMQRKLMKALEDLSLKYDDTVRNSSQGIVQFIFGDDGLSPALMEGSAKPLNFPHTFSHIRHVFPLNLEKVGEEMLIDSPAELKRKGFALVDELAQGLVAAEQFVSDIKAFLSSKADLLQASLRSPGDVKKVVRFAYDSGKGGMTLRQLEEFITVCFTKYRKARTEPGEAVGAVAAQSIGEPATQMTLKTFHFAGVASMNVTLGVPRIKEIINAAKSIATPIITAALVNDVSEPSARVVAGRIERTTIGDIAKYIKIVYDPRDVFVLVKFDLAAINSAQLELSLQSIREEIVAKGSLPVRLKMKPEFIEIRGKDKILIRPSSVTTSESLWFDLQLIKSHLAAVPVRGVKQAKRVVINKEEEKGSGKETLSLLVEGYGLQEIMNTLGVKGEETIGNHVAEVQAVLGIEAARQVIVSEVLKIMKHHGINVDNRHVQLLGDCMTNTGDVLGINRFGISKMRQSTLMLASFEKTSDHLFDAAVHNRLDSVEGVSESIIMGNPMQIGTGLFKLLYSIPEDEILEEVTNATKQPLLALDPTANAAKRKRDLH